MRQQKLVSIITPCYNGEAFVERFFKNILEQTYRHIEVIFVDDGSTDDTGKIAQKYISKFEENGMKLCYIYQENQGQAAAMNQGLPIFHGEYLMWTDSDDILHPQNVEKKVAYLEQHSDVGIVMCQGKKVLDTNLGKKVEEYYRKEPKGEDHFFEDLIISKNVVFTPGIYMVRRKVVLEAFPDRKILVNQYGQNLQMLIPMAYIAKCGYIKEDLFSYVIRNNSHSNTIHTSIHDVLERDKGHETVILQLLDMLLIKNEGEKKKYKDMVHEKYLRTQFDAAYWFHDKKMLKKKYAELKKQGVVQKRDTLIYFAGCYKIIDFCYSVFRAMKKWNYNQNA